MVTRKYGEKHIVSPRVKMLAGTAGGLIEAVLCQPLDVIKTRLQLDKQRRYNGSIVTTFSTMLKEEGPRSLYKGLSPFCVHMALKYALRMGSFSVIQDQLRCKDTGKLSVGRTLISGLAAGVLEAILIVTPFEVVKIRLQKQVTGKNVLYSGPIDCLQKIVRNEGIRSLWKGLTPTMVRNASNQSANFVMVRLINHHVWGKTEGDGAILPMSKTLVTGLCAGAVGPCLNQPFDLAKSRLMAQAQIGKERKYRNALHTIATVFKEEGISKVYAGLSLRLARIAPGQAIMWTVVLRVQSWFENRAIQEHNAAK